MADTPNPVPAPNPRSMSLRLRFEILKRDAFTCQYCGAKAPRVSLQVDHVVPVARGGASEPDNLVAACIDCNAGKADVPLDMRALWEQYGPGGAPGFARTGRHTYSLAVPGEQARFYANLRWFGLGGEADIALRSPDGGEATSSRDEAQAALRRELRALADRHRGRLGLTAHRGLYVLFDPAASEVRVGCTMDPAARLRSATKHRPRAGVLVDLRAEPVIESFGAPAEAVAVWLKNLLGRRRYPDGWITVDHLTYWLIERLSEVGRVARAHGMHPIVSLWNRSLTEWTA